MIYYNNTILKFILSLLTLLLINNNTFNNLKSNTFNNNNNNIITSNKTWNIYNKISYFGILDNIINKHDIKTLNLIIREANIYKSKNSYENDYKALNLYKSIYTSLYSNYKLSTESLHSSIVILKKYNQYQDILDKIFILCNKYHNYNLLDDLISKELNCFNEILYSKEKIIEFIKNNNFSSEQLLKQYLEKIIIYFPNSYSYNYKNISYLNLAFINYHYNNYNDSISYLEKLINNSSLDNSINNNYIINSYTYLLLGDIYHDMYKGPYYDISTLDKSLEYYNLFLYYFPNHHKSRYVIKRINIINDKIAYSKLILGNFYFKINKLNSALIYYKDIINNYQKSKYYNVAKERLAITYNKINYKNINK